MDERIDSWIDVMPVQPTAPTPPRFVTLPMVGGLRSPVLWCSHSVVGVLVTVHSPSGFAWEWVRKRVVIDGRAVGEPRTRITHYYNVLYYVIVH